MMTDTSSYQFDSAVDTSAIVASSANSVSALAEESSSLPATLKRPTFVPTRERVIPDATITAMADKAYMTLLESLRRDRALRLAATRTDLRSCYSMRELSESLRLALLAGISYSDIRTSYHAGRRSIKR